MLRIRLHAIPPATRPRPLARSRHTAEAGEPAWRPHIIAPHTPRPPGLSRHEVLAHIQQQIDDLTLEIDCWLPEFGETALARLFEARARLGDMLHQLGAGDTDASR